MSHSYKSMLCATVISIHIYNSSIISALAFYYYAWRAGVTGIRVPPPPRTQLPVSKIIILIYKHFTEKAYMLRDHRRPLDEAQGGGGGGGGEMGVCPPPPPPRFCVPQLINIRVHIASVNNRLHYFVIKRHNNRYAWGLLRVIPAPSIVYRSLSGICRSITMA